VLDDYVLFDCPGQVELFTHHSSLRNIFFRLQKLGYRVRLLFLPSLLGVPVAFSMLTVLQLVALHLIDSYALTLPTLYISSLLLALRSMLQLDLPHLNILTKIDNLVSYPPLSLPLSYYTEARSLEYILPYLDAEQTGKALAPKGSDFGSDKEDEEMEQEDSVGKFSALNRAIVELVEDFGLVGFETLAVEDRQSMMQLLRTIDRAGGYAFGAEEGANESIWQVVVREGGSAGHMEVRDIEERWIDRREEFDEMERQAWEEEGKMAAQKRDKDAAVERAFKDANGIVEGSKPAQGSGIKVVRKGQS